MSPDESCPHWTLHDGVCRDCGKRPKIERKPMTPNTDSVAVLAPTPPATAGEE